MRLDENIAEFMEWSIKTFEKAEAINSLDKAQEEIKELQMEFQMHEGENSRENELEEYIDIIMCLLHSLAKRGFTHEELGIGFQRKLIINKFRQWKLNANNTYSHIRPIQ